jgi:imidazolonepropionase-like amidohydrolase
MDQLTLITGGKVFNGVDDELADTDILISEGKILEVGRIESSTIDDTIDVGGLTISPGLIDAHVHVCGAELPVMNAATSHWSYLSAFAFRLMQDRLQAGFTTLRDMGGANVGIARALREGLAQGPRLYYSGKLLSQTGGHGDVRNRDYDAVPRLGDCCDGSNKFAWIVNGVDQVRRAVREELRLGANQIKIMASGGILSHDTPLLGVQFSDSEISAAVEEAANHGTYVSAHCHPARAIMRCARLGVRVIEHATMVDDTAIEALVTNKTYTVPTLALLRALSEQASKAGLGDASLEKLHQVLEKAADSVRMLRRAGVPIGFGTDLFGLTHGSEGFEFEERKALEKPIDILRSATSVNADILQQVGKLGCISAGANADLIAIAGDPFDDISVMENPDNIKLVMLGGSIRKMTIGKDPKNLLRQSVPTC